LKQKHFKLFQNFKNKYFKNKYFKNKYFKNKNIKNFKILKQINIKVNSGINSGITEIKRFLLRHITNYLKNKMISYNQNASSMFYQKNEEKTKMLMKKIIYYLQNKR